MSDEEREAPVAPQAVPASLAAAVEGMSWSRNLVGEAGATVHRLHAPGRPSLYLKHGRGDVAQDLIDEMVRLRWLARYTTVPALQGFVAIGDEAWLLMSALPGRTAYDLLEAEPDKQFEVVTLLAAHLRELHAIAIEDCPFNSAHSYRLAQARSRMEAGEVDESDFDDDHEGWTAAQVWDEMMGFLPIEADQVVTHGDFSLDNIMIEDGRVTGLIDLGRVGIADRYQDLAILWNCLDEFGEELQAHLLTAYGLAEPDMRKLDFHLALDEFF